MKSQQTYKILRNYAVMLIEKLDCIGDVEILIKEISEFTNSVLKE